jgi:uncharacterized protein YceK
MPRCRVKKLAICLLAVAALAPGCSFVGTRCRPDHSGEYNEYRFYPSTVCSFDLYDWLSNSSEHVALNHIILAPFFAIDAMFGILTDTFMIPYDAFRDITVSGEAPTGTTAPSPSAPPASVPAQP